MTSFIRRSKHDATHQRKIFINLQAIHEQTTFLCNSVTVALQAAQICSCVEIESINMNLLVLKNTLNMPYQSFWVIQVDFEIGALQKSRSKSKDCGQSS